MSVCSAYIFHMTKLLRYFHIKSKILFFSSVVSPPLPDCMFLLFSLKPFTIRRIRWFTNRALSEATKLALSGRPIYNGISETALTTNFELLNLVQSDHPYHSKINDNQAFPSKSTAQSQHHKEKRSTSNANATNVISTTKWRRVGLVSATSVRLDTIVWPGGDIVVSGTHRYRWIEIMDYKTSQQKKNYISPKESRSIFSLKIDTLKFVYIFILQVCQPELGLYFVL